MFSVHFPSADALATIFSGILSAHFLQGGFSYGVSRSVGILMQVHLLPHSKASFFTVINVKIFVFYFIYLLCFYFYAPLHVSLYSGGYLSASENQPELFPHCNTVSLYLQPARPYQHFPGNTQANIHPRGFIRRRFIGLFHFSGIIIITHNLGVHFQKLKRRMKPNVR